MPNAGRTVVMSRTLWQRLFNADPTALGRDVLVNGTKRELVGIVDLPASDPRVFGCLAALPRRRANLPQSADPPVHGDRTTARLACSRRQAASDLANVSADIQRLAPDAGALTIRATPLRDRIVRSIRPTLLVMWAAVLLLLTIAFANIANLVLTQGSLRAREMSIRTALGAGRWRLLRQLLIENGLLGTVGGVLGTMLGGWAVALVRNLLPGDVPRLTEVTFDPAVAAFGVVLSILCAIVFGAIPALRASLRDPMGPLRGRDLITGSSRLRGGLVAAEVALTLTLLAGAGLLARTLMSVSHVRMGFDPLEVVTIDLSLPSGRYGDVSAQRQFYERALERVRAIGGVGSAAVTGALPLTPTAATGMQPQDGVRISNHRRMSSAPATGSSRHCVFHCGEDACSTRAIVPAERPWPWSASRRRVNSGRPGPIPIGRAITMRDWGEPYRATVIGIVGDVHQAGPDRVVSPTVYYPFAQFPETTLMQTIVVRTNQPTDRIVSSVRDIVHGIDRDQPIAADDVADRSSRRCDRAATRQPHAPGSIRHWRAAHGGGRRLRRRRVRHGVPHAGNRRPHGARRHRPGHRQARRPPGRGAGTPGSSRRNRRHDSRRTCAPRFALRCRIERSVNARLLDCRRRPRHPGGGRRSNQARHANRSAASSSGRIGPRSLVAGPPSSRLCPDRYVRALPIVHVTSRRYAGRLLFSVAALGLTLTFASSCAFSVPGRSARVVRRFPAHEATQAVAVDAQFFYAIDDAAIGKYQKDTGQGAGKWEETPGGPVTHLNSGIVQDGLLYCAHSNSPGVPMVSSVEVFETAAMLTHVRSIPLPPDLVRQPGSIGLTASGG